MRSKRVWARVLGVEREVVIEGVDDDAGDLVVRCRVRPGQAGRCGQCGRRCPGYDQGDHRRRWRALDAGTVRVFIEADAPRVNCPEHHVTVARVPWARHGAGHTRIFDDQVAWLATQCSKTAVTELMRVAWRTVGAIITRVTADIDARIDRLAGLRRIGIDEVSYKRGHRYLTVVVDHDTGALVWAAPGHDKATLCRFFDQLGPQRSAAITHVSADAADWIAAAVNERCPDAVRCADAFHVVAWATDALDEVRRQAWRDARALARTEPRHGPGRPRHDAPRPPRPGLERAQALMRARYALWKNPENLTPHQRVKLDWIARTDPRLHRAYLLKEGLRTVFALKGDAGKEALDHWIRWARRCRIPEFVQLQQRITIHRTAIDAALDSRLSNALIESTNTKIRLLTRIAYGFRNPHALIALALLSLGTHPPSLPGRT